MAYLHDNVLDQGINYIDTNITDLWIVSASVVESYADATSNSALGQWDSPVCSAPTDGDTSGRKVTISAVTAGSITADGDAKGWALVYDAGGSILLASGSLSASQTVTNGNSFSLTAIDIEIPDPPA